MLPDINESPISATRRVPTRTDLSTDVVRRRSQDTCLNSRRIVFPNSIILTSAAHPTAFRRPSMRIFANRNWDFLIRALLVSSAHLISTQNGFPPGGSSRQTSDWQIPPHSMFPSSVNEHESGTCSPQLRQRHPFSIISRKNSSSTAITLPPLCGVQCTAHSSSTTTPLRQSPLNSRAFQTIRSSGIPPCPLLVKTALNFRVHTWMLLPRLGHSRRGRGRARSQAEPRLGFP